jgi:uncharacterized Fe-S radical SAM superfamily protein PflX
MTLQADTEKIAQELIGTAEGIQHVIARLGLAEKYDSETDLDCELFDSIVFNCESCNWWCGADEQNDGPGGMWVCDDCADD